MKEPNDQTYAYFYFMQGSPEAVGRQAPRHAEYWENLGLQGYRGGPFADYSGGMIVFCVQDADLARRLVSGDPFVKHGLVGDAWLKVWRVD